MLSRHTVLPHLFCAVEDSPLRSLFALLTLLVSTAVFAQPRISVNPTAPLSNEPITIRVSDIAATTSVPGCPQVTVVGSRINVVATCGGGPGGTVPTPF